MRLNYSPIRSYIAEVKTKNVDLKAKTLLGININKFFMPSVANVIGTDLSNYKIVEKNQFACNRMHVGRDYRIPVALSKSEEQFIVSPAYDVFEIKDTSVLLPEYLMMWFSRKEYDRNAWFYTDADVRGGLPWKTFCEMQLPIPSITKQREIVAEYNVIQNRITLNQQLIQKLEETAQAIYKQWFVEFEFPDENGLPYKSNGGEMVFNEELEKEIPKGWENKFLVDYTILSQGIQVDVEDQLLERLKGMNRFLRIIDYTPNTEEVPRFVNINDKRYYCTSDEIIMIRYGDAGTVCRRIEGVIANNLFKISPQNGLTNNFLYYFLKDSDNQKTIRRADLAVAMPAITHNTIKELPISYPKNMERLLIHFDNISQSVENEILIKIKEIEYLKSLKNLLLSKLATIEN